MIACRYGTIPVVRKTGGLADSITDYKEGKEGYNGFVFKNYNAHEMLFTIKDAVELYRKDKKTWSKLMYNAMTTDFSWNASAEKYEQLYDMFK